MTRSMTRRLVVVQSTMEHFAKKQRVPWNIFAPSNVSNYLNLLCSPLQAGSCVSPQQISRLHMACSPHLFRVLVLLVLGTLFFCFSWFCRCSVRHILFFLSRGSNMVYLLPSRHHLHLFVVTLLTLEFSRKGMWCSLVIIWFPGLPSVSLQSLVPMARLSKVPLLIPLLRSVGFDSCLTSSFVWFSVLLLSTLIMLVPFIPRRIQYCISILKHIKSKDRFALCPWPGQHQVCWCPSFADFFTVRRHLDEEIIIYGLHRAWL